MSVTIESFPSLLNPDKFRNSNKYRIYGNSGFEAEIINYGARILSLKVPDPKTGEISDIMLGMKGLDEYLTDGANHGAVVGRSANRIARARFELGGITYNIPQNDGENNLHTGVPAFQNKFWDCVVLSREETEEFIKGSEIPCLSDLSASSCGCSVLLTCESGDGECGFPGNLKTSVLYSWLTDNTFLILYKGVSDKATVFAPTNHAYFNLAGHSHGYIGNQILKVMSDTVTLKDENNCPDGTYMDVKDTPFDFIEGAPVSQALKVDHPQISKCLGLDQNFCLRNEGRYEVVSVLQDDASSRCMEVLTDMPGIQFYAGNHLGGAGYKDDADYKPYDALCLEAQMYPNAINIPGFESPVIDKDEIKYHACGYRFV